LKSAPNSTPEEMNAVKAWIEERFPGAEVERDAWLGQLRFNIPSSSPLPAPASDSDLTATETPTKPEKSAEPPSVGSLFVLLEENREKLGLEYHSVSVSTFDEVFLKVVRRHGVGEEDHAQANRWRKLMLALKVLFPCLSLFRSS
jgi:hypothetical protein